MSHIKAVINYVKAAVVVTIQGGVFSSISKPLPKAATVVDWINPVVTVEMLPTPIVAGSTWDNGMTFWDLDGGGTPQSQWDIGL